MALELKLDRDKMHTQFNSWRLQPFATVARYKITTTGHASGVESTALDFLHTRVSVLRNHLLLSEGRLFVFTQTERKSGYYVYELLPDPGCDEGVLARQVAELGSDAGAQPLGGAVEAVVDCSLAVVADMSQQQQLVNGVGASSGAGGDAPMDDTMPGSAASAASASDSSGNDSSWTMLLSRGHGDVLLARRRGNQLLCSNVVHPLRPRLPYTGVRPIVLEAAVAQPNGDITAVAWAMRSRGPHTAACCEVFAITLRPSEEPAVEPGPTVAAAAVAASSGLQLRTVGVRLLLRTKLPPHLVRVLPPAAAATDGADSGGGAAAGGGGVVLLLGFDPNTAGLEDEDEEDEGAGGHAQQGAAAAAAHADADTMAEDDDDGDDLDPRTLEQAAARLAHMTSAERSGPQPPAQWADIYKESGPDGVGAMGAEPVVDLAAWRLGEAAAAAAAGGGSGGGDEKAPQALPPFWRLSCGAHRLLSAEGPLLARQSQPQGQGQGQGRSSPQPLQPVLLGLTDDVDCAVLSVERARPAAAAAVAVLADDEGRSGAAQQQEAAEAAGRTELQARHALSIPALAYVAAGKTYKRHLLLASSETGCACESGPGSGTGSGLGPSSGAGSEAGRRIDLAAVLVESQRFMYLYGSTSVRQEYGRQQVVELGLEEGEAVLGARLLELPAAGGGGGGPIVVVATQRRLLSYRLRM